MLFCITAPRGLFSATIWSSGSSIMANTGKNSAPMRNDSHRPPRFLCSQAISPRGAAAVNSSTTAIPIIFPAVIGKSSSYSFRRAVPGGLISSTVYSFHQGESQDFFRIFPKSLLCR